MAENAITRALRALDDRGLEAVRNMYGLVLTVNGEDRCHGLDEFQLAVDVAAAIEQCRRHELMCRAVEALGVTWHGP